MIADAFEGREFEEGLAVGVEEAAVGFPVAGVVGDVDEVTGDEDGAGVADFAAEWEVLVREGVERVDGGFGAGGAPFIEMDLGVGDDEEGEVVIVVGWGGEGGERGGGDGACELAAEGASGG